MRFINCFEIENARGLCFFRSMNLLYRFVRFCFVIASLLFGAAMTSKAPGAEKPALVYIGTYTDGKSKGIYTARFDSHKGELSSPELATETKNPSFLAAHPNRKFLYAVGETSTFGGKQTGVVSAFGIDAKTGKLNLLNQQSSGGG